MTSEALTLRVLNVPVRTPSSSWVKVPRVIAMSGFPFGCSPGPSRRCLAPGDRKGTAVTASQRAAGAQRRTGEAGKFESAAAREEAGSVAGRGNFSGGQDG